MEFEIQQSHHIRQQNHKYNEDCNFMRPHIKVDKMTKRQIKLAQTQLENLTQMSIHLHALFSAVEHGHLEKAKTILESTDIDINSLNSDGLSALDVAVLSNNRPMTKMLLQHGAVDGNQFETASSLGNHLNELLEDAENRIEELNTETVLQQPAFNSKPSLSSVSGNSRPSETDNACTEADRQFEVWERRVKGLKRMLLGWDQARPPDVPSSVTVDIIGLTSVVVCILEPIEGSLCTKFQIQWSTSADFNNIIGEKCLFEWNCYQGIMGTTCKINDLTEGRKYFFRANCGNVKGWGPFRQSVPFSIIPSVWRDVDKKEHRFIGRQQILDELFVAVCLTRPAGASALSLCMSNTQRLNPRKKPSIKQLFSAAAKFQKNLKRGIHLACILYYDERILVTNEDFLPVIEIDETYPSSLNSDYLWFMKVSCTWSDVKSLRTDMEKNPISTLHFRTKLLAAACQMQSALSMSDLGQLYYKPLKDSNGTVVLCSVNLVKNIKGISVPNTRWISINKIQKRVTSLRGNNGINEILINSITEQITYSQNSIMKLSRGLYLGYLKMQSSVDQIQIIVPAKIPNVLPHCKVRDNPHISAEEWKVLKLIKIDSDGDLPLKLDESVQIQKLFLKSLIAASNKLFSHMNINRNAALTHRLYNVEVIELSPDVSFLIMCPPAESYCAISGQQEILLERGDLISLSLQAFEMLQLKTYQSNIIQRYSRLSCILELETSLATHSHREAFSNLEIQATKERLSKLHELTTRLNTIWKNIRWLSDVIAFMRDKESTFGISIKELLEFSKIKELNETFCTNNQTQLLKLPKRGCSFVKTTSDRGSWPGTITNSCLESNNLLITEYSRSEHDLECTSINTKVSSTISKLKCSSRKNSIDSQSSINYFSAGEAAEPVVPRLPPSKSEDTLVGIKKRSTIGHRKRLNYTSINLVATHSRPHLTSKTNKNTVDSLQNLSSDSESSTQTLISAANKLEEMNPKIEKFQADSVNFLNPTLTAIQKEIKFSKDTLYVSKPSSPISKPSEFYGKCLQYSSDDEGFSMLDNSKLPKESRHSGIIQVYAAYETGLAHGTSLKLHVTLKTTAREVVDLVVKQLNMAIVLKGKDGPIYTPEKLENFCLVAVIGARERCLRDDFKPLQLQNPWKKGRLYVRQKHDLLAAIEYSNKDTQLI